MDVKAPLSLDAVIKLAFCLEGRDKLSKMLQYGSRALAFYVLSADPKSDAGQRLHALYKAMQQSRKAFRLGKSVTYYKKLQTLSGNKRLSEGQRYLQFVQNVGMLGYFVTDNLAFASKVKVLRFDAEELARRGGVMWFCANLAGFFNAVDGLNADVEKEKCVRDILASEEDATRVEALQSQLEALRGGRFKKLLAVLKVTCDLIVSSNTSGVRLAERISGAKLHDGIIGSVGCVSAAVVLYNTWPSAPKTPTEKKVEVEVETKTEAKSETKSETD
ncbi:Peroxisomal membrane protein PMP27 [Phytophthora pseudosyringae]|uniref:Peroxisomal membrane protein PMP27 n=1 Tax=Phytophthora pseudosyringae TaxID=221518 RepID=A0A8T1VPC7_9STRA|nr:Peroxisomal membrane protein PMP27 [Phytophthora pseudosyringae]